ncbi:golgi-body localization protein domain-containing protein [Umbelopsis sp. AD052]|nr:golgi-body localization protein domain-containing protein [Umbelopsis sp. AD052]
MIWCEPNRDSFKLLYSKSLQLNISRSVNATPNDASSGVTCDLLICTNVGVSLDQPAVTISYDVLYPLKAEILDICQAWDPKQVNKLATDIDVNLPTGRLHTTFSASHPALRIKDANENVITQIDASLFRVTMDTTRVEDFEIQQSYTPDQSNSSDTLVDSYTSSNQSSTHILQRYKTDLSLEVEELTTWKQCLRYLSEREFTPSACNYFAVDQFCLTYTSSSFSRPSALVSNSILDELPRPSCCLTFGSIHMDVRDAPYFVERAIPWVVMVSNLFKNDSPQLVQASTSSNCSPLVRIIIYSVDASFLAIDRPLDPEIDIPSQHFCNAPSEDIGCGVLFSAADVIIAISSLEDINSIRASSNDLNDISVSAKEISLCSLVDEEGENCIFSLGEEPMLWIPDLAMRCHEERGFPEDVRFGQVVSMEISLIQFCWAPQALYSALCLVQCMKDTQSIFKQMNWGNTNPQADNQSTFKSLRMSASTRQIVGRFSLSPSMKIQMEVSDASAHILPNHTMLSLGELRFYGTAKHGMVWKRLLFASQLKLNQIGSNESKIIMQTLCFRLPYNYVCATIVEAAIHAFKLTKTLFNRLVRGNTTEWQGPSDKAGPVNIPSIQLRVNQVSVEFEDDPFESRLRLLWKTSLSEQPRRVKTEEAFHDKVNAMFEERQDSGSSNNGQKLPDSLRLTAMIADLRSKRNSTEMRPGLQFASHDIGKDRSSNDIEATWQRLQEYNSKCWINEVRSAIKQEETAIKGQRSAWYQPPFKQAFEEGSPSSHFEYRLPHSSYCQHAIDITADPINPYSPLLGLSVDNLTIDITSPSFPLDQTTSFIQDVGEGVPLNTAYSILLPFRMYCSGAKTVISLRDYPLPLLRVPEDKSARREFRTAWTLTGDFVIADELGDVAGAWLKPMTLIPERNYTVNLLRVASPLKFFSIVDIEVHTPEVTYIAWSMSVQPAIEDIIRIIDSFTPLPIDPSPKLGFWDKVRLMIHSRTRIRFLGQGDLALWMKGKRDPYSLAAEGAGIIKVWQRNVECRLGYTNSENELLQIFSDEYILAVPNVDFDDGSNSLTESQSKGMFFIEEPQEYINDQKYQKTVLSLTNGVRWGLACHFERFCRRGCAKCNTTNSKGSCKLMTFEPHYLVVYRTPEIVQKHYVAKEYDSFDGFRSRWIHLSFTVSNNDFSNSNQLSPNALRLTPKFLSHFVDWFSLFGGENGLPIRTGKMFPREDHRPTQKFGKHLGTLRYQIVLNCLFLSHIYKDEESGFEGDFLGFKANTKSFILDIHQRREHMQKDHHLLGSRSTSKWPMYEGEVIFDTMDIRVILATYLQSQPISRSDYESSEEADRQWIDQLDYCEIGVPAIMLPPATKLLPFVTAPYLSMRKTAKEAEKEKSAHLHGVHQCYIGNSPTTSDVQIRLHKERYNVINDHVRKIEVEIVDLEAKIAQNPNDTELLAESLSLLESTAQLYEKKRQLNLYLQEMLEGDRNSPSMRSVKNFGGGSLAEWEQLMGVFQVQLVLHNPCIIWNNEIRNVVYRFMDLQDRSKTRNLLLSTKTLRSLMNASNFPAPCVNDNPTPIIDNTSSNKNTVHDILESLASADGQQSVALSECDDWLPSLDSSPDTVSDMNDPIWQQKSLSPDHQIKNNYTLDLLNPQFLFKSTKSTSGILVSAERAHLKGLTIFNKNTGDPDTDYIQERSLCRIDNSQFSIVKNVKTHDITSTLYDRGRLNSLPWIPLEALVDENFASQDYERVAAGVSATLQYDDYNKLSMEPSQHPFEENANGVRLHFPAITLTANSTQYNILYDVFKDLLLYSEPAKVDRQASLQEMMFISDLDTLPYVLDAAVLLKDNIRQHREALQQYHQYISVLTEEQFEQYIALSKSHFELYDELYLLMESVKIAQSDRQSFMRLEAKTSLKFEVIANKVCWKMVLAATSHMFEWDLTHVNFMWLGKEDRSVKYKLELDKIVILHERDDKPVELVGPHYLNDRKYINFSKHKMLQGYLVETASVGGIPVVEHMEIKLAPIKINMTYDIAKALASYLFPPEKRYQDISEANEFEPVSGDHDVPFDPEMNAAEASTSIPTTESPKKRRALSLGKLSDFYGRVRRTDWNATAADDSTIGSGSADISLNRPRRWSAVNLWWNEISVMRKRASNTRCFIYVKIPGAKHCLTYKGPKNRNFADMNNFVFKQPTIELRNRTCSWYELLDMVKKEILLAAVLHSGSLIKEKILPRGARRPLSWHSQRPGRWAFSQSARSLTLSSSSEDSTIEDSEDDARSMISSFSRAEEDIDSTRDLSVGSIQQSSIASRPASMISDSSKKQRWTQRIANKRPKFPNPFSANLRRRGSQRSNIIPSDVMEKGKLLLGKQYDGPMNRARVPDSIEP